MVKTEFLQKTLHYLLICLRKDNCKVLGLNSRLYSDIWHTWCHLILSGHKLESLISSHDYFCKGYPVILKRDATRIILTFFYFDRRSVATRFVQSPKTDLKTCSGTGEHEGFKHGSPKPAYMCAYIDFSLEVAARTHVS